jgi:hypothetical protein
MFSGNIKLSFYCLHYFTVSSYSYYVALKLFHDDYIFGWIFSLDQSQTPKSTRHITGDASDSRHPIFVNSLCVVQKPKIHYHTLTLKTFPLRILAQFRTTLQLAAPQKPAKSRAIWHVWNARLKAVNTTNTVFRMWRRTFWQIGTHCFHLKGRSLMYWTRVTVGYPQEYTSHYRRP